MAANEAPPAAPAPDDAACPRCRPTHTDLMVPPESVPDYAPDDAAALVEGDPLLPDMESAARELDRQRLNKTAQRVRDGAALIQRLREDLATARALLDHSTREYAEQCGRTDQAEAALAAARAREGADTKRLDWLSAGNCAESRPDGYAVWSGLLDRDFKAASIRAAIDAAMAAALRPAPDDSTEVGRG